MAIVWIGVLYLQKGAPSGALFVALLLILCETVVVISMALFFTSFSSPFLSGLFCLGIFVAGRNADLISQLGQQASMAWMAPFLDGVSAVLPNFYLFFPSGKMVEGAWATAHSQFVSSGYVVSAVGYGLAYTGGFLLLSIALLRRRDFI